MTKKVSNKGLGYIQGKLSGGYDLLSVKDGVIIEHDIDPDDYEIVNGFVKLGNGKKKITKHDN